MDEIIRSGVRLAKAPIAHDARQPVILPKALHLTDLIIRQHHERAGHSGMGHTWTPTILDHQKWCCSLSSSWKIFDLLSSQCSTRTTTFGLPLAELGLTTSVPSSLSKGVGEATFVHLPNYPCCAS